MSVVGAANDVTCVTGYHTATGLAVQALTCQSDLEYSPAGNCIGMTLGVCLYICSLFVHKLWY